MPVSVSLSLSPLWRFLLLVGWLVGAVLQSVIVCFLTMDKVELVREKQLFCHLNSSAKMMTAPKTTRLQISYYLIHLRPRQRPWGLMSPPIQPAGLVDHQRLRHFRNSLADYFSANSARIARKIDITSYGTSAATQVKSHLNAKSVGEDSAIAQICANMSARVSQEKKRDSSRDKLP
ncbi:uncharacterized protein LOC111272104 [Varroa jacobsoni]|uniref:uncharacterized protein LOC111272104 n=1 Tax=Varroa jacobsoni TaxID=62625 RepID=UPI000BF509FE|nr:uncharacterized protein LOC111272104 [Varroa jacobsoni]